MHVAIIVGLLFVTFGPALFTLAAIDHLGMPQSLGWPVGIVLFLLSSIGMFAAHPLINGLVWAVAGGAMVAIAFASSPDQLLRVAVSVALLGLIAAGLSATFRAEASA